MRALAGFVVVSLSLAAVAEADLLFVVDEQGVVECGQLGEIAAGFAQHKRAGMSSGEMHDAMMQGGVHSETADAIVKTLYSFDAKDRETYSAVVGALCIIDKLQVIKLDR